MIDLSIAATHKGTSQYVVNDEDYGHAFDNIDTTNRYRLAIRISTIAKNCVIPSFSWVTSLS